MYHYYNGEYVTCGNRRKMLGMKPLRKAYGERRAKYCLTLAEAVLDGMSYKEYVRSIKGKHRKKF